MAGQPTEESFPIYWEKQESALCGTHAINNLLQGPYYTEIQMAEMAQAIDVRERALMAENGVDSSEYLSFMSQDSSNVDESGNFSIEVLSQALQNFGLSCVNLASPDCKHQRDNPLEQTAFLCNLQSHWLSIRKINGKFFNLNSLQHDNDGWGPSFISEFYLSAYLDELRQRKYTIFLIDGDFPPVDTETDLQGRGRWFDSNEVIEYTRNPQKLKRLKAQHAPSGQARHMYGADADLARAIAASMQTSESGGSTVWKGPKRSAAGQPDEDEDLRRALQLSMQDVTPQSPATAVSVPAQTPAAAAATSSAPSPAPPAAASTSAPMDSSPTPPSVASHPNSTPSPEMLDAALAVMIAAQQLPSSGATSPPANVPAAAAVPVLAGGDQDDEDLRLAIQMSLQQ